MAKPKGKMTEYQKKSLKKKKKILSFTLDSIYQD